MATYGKCRPANAARRIRSGSIKGEDNPQHPLQILLILRSSFRFSAATAASVLLSNLVLGPGTDVPPAARDDAVPPRPGVAPGDPVEFAVPAAFVPGVWEAFAALPAPLGSLTELFVPPALPGPMGTPLTPALPAPAEPAAGEPTALPLLAAPPPADEPPPAPPLLWAKLEVDPTKLARTARTTTAVDLDMWPLRKKTDLNERRSGFVPDRHRRR
jgi:hypothetical protein